MPNKIECKGLNLLKSGDFNNMEQKEQKDGLMTIKLTSHKYKTVYEFQVKDLYQATEEVVKIISGD
jgi:tyrosine-protein phosphatase YwqE